MTIEKKPSNLGRGLSALLGEGPVETVSVGGDQVQRLPISKLQVSPFQPRRIFNEEDLNDLIESVRQKGILQPLLVRPNPDVSDMFEIIAGERRWRAAQAAGLEEVPVLVKEFSNQEALEVALIENLQRKDLTPLEEAEGYRRLMEEFSHTQEDLAKVVGKSRSHVANMMRLLALPDSVKRKIEGGELTAGHARAILNAKDPEDMAEKIVSKGLNVRQTEKLVQEEGQKKEKASSAGLSDGSEKSESALLSKDLSDYLGIKVQIKTKGLSGDILFSYTTLEQLDQIITRISQGGNINHIKEKDVYAEKPEISSDVLHDMKDMPDSMDSSMEEAANEPEELPESIAEDVSEEEKIHLDNMALEEGDAAAVSHETIEEAPIIEEPVIQETIVDEVIQEEAAAIEEAELAQGEEEMVPAEMSPEIEESVAVIEEEAVIEETPIAEESPETEDLQAALDEMVAGGGALTEDAVNELIGEANISEEHIVSEAEIMAETEEVPAEMPIIDVTEEAAEVPAMENEEEMPADIIPEK